MSQETKMDKITTEMIEYVCDNVCVHAFNDEITQEELEDICADCEMGKLVCDILNTYNEDREHPWIPVNKEIPHKKGVYQVTLKKDRDRCVGFGVFNLETKEWYENQNRVKTFKSAGYDVIAWKLLPQSYKEVEHE